MVNNKDPSNYGWRLGSTQLKVSTSYSRVGFFPGKNYFLLSGGKKLEISGKNWKKWKFPEKTMLSSK